jgi:hypothetical protein
LLEGAASHFLNIQILQSSPRYWTEATPYDSPVTNSFNRGIVTHKDARQLVQLAVLIQESEAKEERRE